MRQSKNESCLAAARQNQAPVGFSSSRGFCLARPLYGQRGASGGHVEVVGRVARPPIDLKIRANGREKLKS